jgi:lipopolysaccharide transport system permease protein
MKVRRFARSGGYLQSLPTGYHPADLRPISHSLIVLSSLYRYRAFIWQHALADLRHRYAGSGMGAVWNILHPLSLIGIYAIIFGAFMGRTLAEVPGSWGFTIYLCAGFFPWVAFTDCVNRGSYSLIGNAAYLKKLPVPEQVFIAQAAMGAAITLVISYLLFTVIALFLGAHPSRYWLLIPMPMLALLATGFGIGMIVGTLNVFFTDVQQILGIVLQVLFWLTPIVYTATSIAARSPFLGKAIKLSPVTPALEIVHDLFVFNRLPERSEFWVYPAMIGWAAVSLLLGTWTLNKLRGEIRDVL